MKLKFDPLHNEDGTPCYFRASCLALFAICLILHVFLKNPVQDAVSLNGTPQLMPQSSGTVTFAANSSKSNEVIPSTQGEIRSLPVTQDSATVAHNQTVNVTVQPDSPSWSIFASEEDKELASLFKNRKAALAELADGVSFLSSCGNINASYNTCKFDFSSKVRKNYVSKVVAADRSFSITLVAKGEQKRDACSRFEISSDGVLQAYDVQGRLNNQCFANSAMSNQVLAISGQKSNVSTAQSSSQTVLAESHKVQ